MSRRAFITNITPLPPTVSRETAIGLLHDHGTVIELNPLVVRHNETEAPPNATQEEKVKCRWYEIVDQINYLPGGAVKGEISYKGGFYDLPTGLQTHVFAPGGVDLKGVWKVAGSVPGEPREPPELGVNVPPSGLYLREDVEVRCNVFLMSFVKRNMRKSHAVLVERLLAKALEAEAKKQEQIRKNSITGTDFRQPMNIISSGCPRDNVLDPAPSDLSSSTSISGTTHERRAFQDYTAHRAPQPPAQSVSNHAKELYQARSSAHELQGPPLPTAPGPRQHSEPFGFGKPLPPDPPHANGAGRYRSPQLFGEQAELSATTLASDSDNWPDAPPNCNPSVPRDAADGEVMELDSSEVAYWKQLHDTKMLR